ncbi:hypothetical protein D3C71_420480 [compost metagenome]
MTGIQGKNERLLEAALEGRFLGDMELLEPGLLPATTWLVHFGGDADSIAERGFTKGTPEMDSLHLCYGADSAVPGYNFAMLADDEFGLRTLCEYTFGSQARDAVIFQSAAVKLGHYDEFTQAVFWGPEVEGPFIRIRCPLDPDNEDDEDRLMELEEPHRYPWDVVAADGSTRSSHRNLFEAIDAAVEYHAELTRSACPAA